jgi:hypothetical protein
VLVADVDVAPARVRLPHLDELMRDRAPVAVQHPAADDDPLADRLAAVLDGQVRLGRADVPVAEAGRPQLDGLRVGVHQALRRVPQQTAPVRRVVQPRLITARAVEIPDLLAELSLRLQWFAHPPDVTQCPGGSLSLRFH